MGEEGVKQVLRSELVGGPTILRVLLDLLELLVPSKEAYPSIGTLMDGITWGPDTTPFIC